MISEQTRGSILLAIIDMPGRSMNVFSEALMDAVELVIEHVETDPSVHGLVLTSGKSAFLAGADLEMARRFTQLGLTAGHNELHTVCGRLGRLFLRLEGVAKPTIAALNGLALGGGLEVAMACRWRIAADDPRVQLGLPEIRLGLMPGGGGTQRLPRLIGIERGLELLLNGESIGPIEAKRLRLVDEVVPKEKLIDRAVEFAEQAAQGQAPSKFPARLDPGPFKLSAPDIIRQVSRHYGYVDEVTAAYPAYNAIVRSVVEARDMSVPEGTRIEMDRVVELMQNPVAGNMVSTLFLSRQRANKLLREAIVATRFAVSGADPGAQALRLALHASMATVVDFARSEPSDIRIAFGALDSHGSADLKVLLAAQDRRGHLTGIHVASSPEYGHVVEIVADSIGEAGVGKALALAKQLKATPYFHAGQRSLLASLARIKKQGSDDNLPSAVILAAQGLEAKRWEAHNEIGETALADVACVVGGLSPAYSGGPFTWWSSAAALNSDVLRSAEAFLSEARFVEE